ncbi:hypothetical protein EJB05_08036, partial [Eragrostis curvula]
MEQEQERGAGAGHLLLFPFLAQGHIIPFLNLAKRIEGLEEPRRPRITIVSTPRNVAGLRRAVPAGSSIGFAELPFCPSDHGLPADAESTDVIPFMDYPALFFATESLRAPFEKLVSELAAREGCKNVCVLADFFMGWTAESARELGVQHRLFVTSGAYASAVTFCLWLRQPTFPRPVNPDDEQAVPDFPDVRLRHEQLLNVVITEDESNPMTQFLRRTLNLHFRHSGGVIVNTAEEIEAKGLEMIGKLSGVVGGLDKGWEHVSDVVETVLGDGEKARDMRAKAAELKKLARAAVSVDGKVKGSSVLAMERLLDGAFR